MKTFIKGTLAALGSMALAAPALAQFGGPPPPPNTGIPLAAHLAGGNAGGQITVVVDPPKGTACYLMNVSGLAEVTAALDDQTLALRQDEGSYCPVISGRRGRSGPAEAGCSRRRRRR